MFWNQNSSTMRYNKVKRDWLLLLDIFLMYADIYNLDIYVQPQVSVNFSTSLMMIDACAALDVLCLGTESVGDIGGEARALAQCTQLPGP